MPSALQSLYGDGHANATRMRECVAMPGKREQTVLTPMLVAVGLGLLWREGVACDPCSAPGQLVKADEKPKDGLAVPWPRRTFCNPPYGELERWLDYGCIYDDVVWLVPARVHRKWFRAWLRGLSCVIALDPLVFAGHKQSFPAPLILGYQGPLVLKFSRTFERLGGLIW